MLFFVEYKYTVSINVCLFLIFFAYYKGKFRTPSKEFHFKELKMFEVWANKDSGL